MKKYFVNFIIPGLALLIIVISGYFIFTRTSELNYKSDGNDIKVTYNKTSAGSYGLASNIYPKLYLNNKIVSNTESERNINPFDFYPLNEDFGSKTKHYEFTKDHSKTVNTGFGGDRSNAWYIFVDPEKFSNSEYESILKVLQNNQSEIDSFLKSVFSNGTVYTNYNIRLGGIAYTNPITTIQYTCDDFTSFKLYQSGKLEISVQNIGSKSGTVTQNLYDENRNFKIPEIGLYYYNEIFPNAIYDKDYLLRCQDSDRKTLGELLNITVTEVPKMERDCFNPRTNSYYPC